jgi:hyperosmotically inducible protein
MINNKSTALVLGLSLALMLPACNVLRGQQSTGDYVDDVALTTRVKSELLDSSKVDGLDVNVNVNDGRVTLTGWASTMAERTRATELTRAITGVRSVDNQLKIKQ